MGTEEGSALKRRLCKHRRQLPQAEEQDAPGTGSPSGSEVCSQGPSQGNADRPPTSNDGGCRKRLCKQSQVLQVWGALQPVVGDKPSSQGGRLYKEQTLQIRTKRWRVKICKQAQHLQAEKCFPDRSRCLSRGQALQG